MSRRALALAAGLATALALAGCASVPPYQPPVARGPAAAAPAPAPAALAPTVPATGAAADSAPSREALDVLATIPEPLAAGERVPPPQAAATEAAEDSGGADVPVPARTPVLGERPLPVVLAPADTASSGVPATPAALSPAARALAAPKPAPAAPVVAAGDTCWRVQLAATAERAKAQRYLEAGRSQLPATLQIEQDKGLYKVRSRDCLDGAGADALRRRALDAGFDGAFRFRETTVSRYLLLYENPRWERLSPVADLLPVPGLRFGAATLGERWVGATGLPLLAVEARAEVLAAWREPLAPARERPAAEDEVLVVDAAALPGGWVTALVESAPPALLVAGGEIVGARARFGALAACLGAGAAFEERLAGLGLPRVDVEATVLGWPWDLVKHNPAALEADLAALAGRVEGAVDPNVALLERGRIVVEAGARVDPFAVLDARGGPVLIRRDAVVQAHSLVVGPCVIGVGTHVLGGVVGHSSVGPQCRLAGEMEDSVWQGWANKRHHGFVGHSAVGEWVNLGALTTTSDLKNNYGPVRAWAAGSERDSGSNKVGSIIGAHVKTGIGTLLPTGCSIGAGSNLFGGGRFVPKRVPGFSWWDGERTVEHRVDAFLETAAVAMGRRGVALQPAEAALLRALSAAGADERERRMAKEAEVRTGRG